MEELAAMDDASDAVRETEGQESHEEDGGASIRCTNCGALLSGRYCAECGQRVVPLRPTLHDLVHEAVHELLHVDGKIVQTVKLLITSPGHLTCEFIAGRRARYITPIRLYLLASVLFFGITALLPSHTWHVTVGNTSYTRLQRGATRINRNPELLIESFKHNIPRMAFLLMPLMGAFVFLLYRRAEPTYVPHLYFAVHYNAFAFVLMTGIALLMAIRSAWTALAGFLLFLVTLPYLASSLRTVYGGGRTITILKAVAIWAAYLFCVFASVLGIMLLTVYQAG